MSFFNLFVSPQFAIACLIITALGYAESRIKLVKNKFANRLIFSMVAGFLFVVALSYIG